MRFWSMVSAAALMSIQVIAMPAQKQIIGTPPASGTPFSPAVKAGGFVFVAGTLATDSQGKIAGSDVKAQTKQVLETIAGVLRAAGSSLEQAASVHVYLKRASDFQAMNEVYRTYWKAHPPVRTTVEADFVVPDALVEISMVAVPNGGDRKVVHPPEWLASPSPYSYGIESGNTLFLSGLVSRNGKDNSVVTGDITTQTKTVMENAGAILKAAGMSHSDVVSSRVYITDTALFQGMNAAYRTYFPKDPPARATVRAGLMGPQYVVEITMVAVQEGDRQALITPNADGTACTANPNLSSSVRVGNRLYVSGMLGNTDANKGDVRSQTRETLVRIGRTLKAAGFEWPHVVDGIVYLTDLSQFGAMNEAYREVFAKDFPARATVRSGLVAPDGLVEIMFTAVRP